MTMNSLRRWITAGALLFSQINQASVFTELENSFVINNTGKLASGEVKISSLDPLQPANRLLVTHSGRAPVTLKDLGIKTTHAKFYFEKPVQLIPGIQVELILGTPEMLIEGLEFELRGHTENIEFKAAKVPIL